MFDGLWTVPNAITLIRLLLLPVFLYLLLVEPRTERLQHCCSAR